MEISTEEKLELRRYQASLENRVFRAWEKGSEKILMQLPTGGGKTSVFSSIAKKFISDNLRVLVVAHKEELVLQNAKSLEKWCKSSCGLIKAGYKPDYNLDLQSASIQSLINRLDIIGNFDLIIIDEAHRSPSNIYSSLFELPDTKILGVTATPMRNDKKEFADFYNVLVPGIQTRQLIQRQYLSNYRFFTDRNPMQWQAARIIDGDFSASDIAGMNDIVELSSTVVESYKIHGEDGTCLVFAVNVEHSLKIVEAYNRAGISAIHLDANSTRKYRKEVLGLLADGSLKIISNVALFGEGLDIPGLNCVQIVRPTQSLGLHLQMLGRVLRRSAGKEYAIVLDHTENYERLGFADDDRHWSLDRQPIVEKSEQESQSSEECSGADEFHGIHKTDLFEITAAEREAKRQKQKEIEREKRRNKREAERQKKAALKLQEEQAARRKQYEEQQRLRKQEQEQAAAEQAILNNRNNRRQERKAIAQQQIAELTARIMKALQDEENEDDNHCAAILNKRNSKLETEKIKELEKIKTEQNALKRKLALAGLNRRQEWERIRSVVNIESREDAIDRLRNLEDHKYIFFIESPLLDDLSIEGVRLLIREYYDIELFNSPSSAKEIWRFIVERLIHYESYDLRTKKWATELLDEMPTPKWVWQEIATAFEYKPGWVHYKYNAEKELNTQNIQGENLIIDELWDCVLSQLIPSTNSLFKGYAKLKSVTNDLVTIEVKRTMRNLAEGKIPELTEVLSRNLGRSISIQFVEEKYNLKGNTTANSLD